MATKRITELPAENEPLIESLLEIVDDPGGTPASKKAVLGRMFAAFNLVGGIYSYNGPSNPIPYALVNGVASDVEFAHIMNYKALQCSPGTNTIQLPAADGGGTWPGAIPDGLYLVFFTAAVKFDAVGTLLFDAGVGFAGRTSTYHANSTMIANPSLVTIANLSAEDVVKVEVTPSVDGTLTVLQSQFVLLRVTPGNAYYP